MLSLSGSNNYYTTRLLIARYKKEGADLSREGQFLVQAIALSDIDLAEWMYGEGVPMTSAAFDMALKTNLKLKTYIQPGEDSNTFVSGYLIKWLIDFDCPIPDNVRVDNTDELIVYWYKGRNCHRTVINAE